MSEILIIANFPTPPHKNGQNRGAVAGHNKGDTLEYFQFRQPIMTQYDNTEQRVWS